MDKVNNNFRSRQSTDEIEKCARLRLADSDWNAQDLRRLAEASLPDDELIKLWPGFYEPLPNTTEVPPLPCWADIEKVKKGQQFGLKYRYGLNYAEMLSLMITFSAPIGSRPLIFTEQSHTPKLAYKRYLSTALTVKSWYETEFWRASTSGYENLKKVKSLHLRVSKRLNQLSEQQIRIKCNLKDKLARNARSRSRDCVENADADADGGGTADAMLCPLLPVLRKDFEKNPNFDSPFACFDQIMSRSGESRRVYINQFDMGAAQFSFFGLMLMYPEKFGASNATQEELECFVHMWRLIGYLLGIKNEYNVCDGSMSQVKSRCKQAVDLLVMPTLLHVTKEWEHLSRCAVFGIEKFTKLKINFEATVLYICWVLDVPTPHLLQYVGWKEMAMFRFNKFIMTEASRIPGFASLINYTISKIVQKSELEN